MNKKQSDFSFGEVEDAMMTLLGIQETRRKALRSRIQYLQRQGFFGQGGKGRGRRVAYGEDDVRKLALVLHLARSGLPSQLAITMVERHWKTINEPSSDTTRKSGIFAVFRPEAMSEFGEGERSSVEILEAQEIATRYITGGSSLALSAVVIDLSTLFRNLEESLGL